MATEPPESEPAEIALSLPEEIGPADLDALNEALAALFDKLRFARHVVTASSGNSKPSLIGRIYRISTRTPARAQFSQLFGDLVKILRSSEAEVLGGGGGEDGAVRASNQREP